VVIPKQVVLEAKVADVAHDYLTTLKRLGLSK